jgi:hypothetical protein
MCKQLDWCRSGAGYVIFPTEFHNRIQQGPEIDPDRVIGASLLLEYDQKMEMPSPRQ